MWMVDWNEDRQMREAAVEANNKVTAAIQKVHAVRVEGTSREFVEALEAFEAAVKNATRKNDAVAASDKLFKSEAIKNIEWHKGMLPTGKLWIDQQGSLVINEGVFDQLALKALKDENDNAQAH